MIKHLIHIVVISAFAFSTAVAEQVVASSITPAVASPQISKFDELLQLGVPQLALRLVEHEQPELAENNTEIWLKWEHKRIRLLQRLQQWPSLIQRIDQYIQRLQNYAVSSVDINWFRTEQVKAHLQLNQSQTALLLTQQLLWNADIYVDSDTIAQWRRLIIRSYLNLNRVEDAQRAMRRYSQDYGNMPNQDGIQWQTLQAQLLMRTQRAAEAVSLLQTIDAPAAKAQLLMAKMQAHMLSSEAVRLEAQKMLSTPELDESLQRVYLYVLLMAAMSDQVHTIQIQALEALLVMSGNQQLEELFAMTARDVSADTLWSIYESYGYTIANQQKLLRGDDEGWYLIASNLFETNSEQAKAIFTVLAFNAKKTEHRHQAMRQLVALLDKQVDGLELINLLFLHSAKVANIEQVPVEVRYRLVDYALGHADLTSAARLMEKLHQPPEGEDLFAWSLRRARVLILGGQYQEGVTVMSRLLDTHESLEQAHIDQYMQVVFDLQNVQQHPLALAAFEQLQRHSLPARLHREIAFWKAESLQALSEYEQAAYLFLKSAKPLDNGFDPWFHTASFRAAEALAQAELIEDARRQYIRLLRITADSARKAVIRQRLQQLRLKQGQQAGEVTVESAAR